MRRSTLLVATLVAFGLFAPAALAAGGSYVFSGATPKQQATVRSALDASSFDWGLIPKTVTVHVGSYGGSYSEAGAVYLDASLLDSGRFAWGVVQHEFAHQVDFLLLDDAKRAELSSLLGGKDWCYSVAGLAHSDYGCERFASELAWAYWQSPDSSMAPAATGGESGAAPLVEFRLLLAQLLGAPTMATPPATKAFAPATAPHRTKPKPKHSRRRR
jgi:hypothetical protein